MTIPRLYNLGGLSSVGEIKLSSGGITSCAKYKAGQPPLVEVSVDSKKVDTLEILEGWFEMGIAQISTMSGLAICTTALIVSEKWSDYRGMFYFLLLAVTSVIVFRTYSFYRLLNMKKRDPDALGWHGAEHKVIGCYEKTYKYDVEGEKLASIVNRNCGSRFSSFLCLWSLINLIVIGFGFVGVSGACLWSCSSLYMAILWIRYPNYLDELRQQIGVITQPIFSVREPTDIELFTAHCALVGLLKAHGAEIEMPEGASFTMNVE